MNAVCYSCGAPKSEPLITCEQCSNQPIQHEDRVASMALSLNCLKPHHLEKATDYIKRTAKLPKFHDSVRRKALELIESMLELAPELSDDDDSMEFSSSFFEFVPDDIKPLNKRVTVHAIGKPSHFQDDAPPNGQVRSNTYHTMEWEVGLEITEEQASLYLDPLDNIYIWYRWLGNKWTWKCVSREEFEQIRKVEA